MSDRSSRLLREAFEYPFSPVDPVGGAHIDPTSTAIYETIVAKGVDGKTSPSMADAWTVSPDGLEWRFKLRPGLLFHSGAPCDGPAVAKALHRCQIRDGKTPQRHYWDSVAEVRAASSDTVTIRTKYPTTRVPSLLWGTHTTIFNENMRDQEKPFENYGIGVADGTGPFKLADWSLERVLAKRWDAYPGTPLPFIRHRTGAAHIAAIEWLAVPDESERLRMLDRGLIDCLHAPPLGEVASIAVDPRFELLSSQQASNVYFAVNWARTDLGFDDVRVRRALSLAIDRAALVAKVQYGHGEPTYGPLPPGDEYYDRRVNTAGRHDPAEAARLLDEAGWKLGERGLRWKDGKPFALECITQKDTVLEGTAAFVAAQLRRIGIELTVEAIVPFSPFYARLRQKPASFISKWLWEDPVDALIGFTSTAGQTRINWQGASIPKLDRAFDDWLRARDDAGLADAADRVQHVTASELPIIPLFTPTDFWVHHKRVSGWAPIKGNLYPHYQDVRIAD